VKELFFEVPLLSVAQQSVAEGRRQQSPAKQLELAREVVPGATRIGLIDDVTDPKAHPQRQEIEAAGRTLNIEIVPAEVRTAADIDAAYQALASAGVQAVVVEQSNMLLFARQPIAEAAATKRLPTVYGYREHAEAGGLISYGINLGWCYLHTAYRTCQSNFRPTLNWSSTSRPPGRSASTCRRRCSPAPTRS